MPGLPVISNEEFPVVFVVSTLFQQFDDVVGLVEPSFTTQKALTFSFPFQLTFAVMLPPLVTIYGLIIASVGAVGVVSITSANDVLDTGDILPDVFLTYAT